LLTFVRGGRARLPDTPPPHQVKPVDDPAFVVDAGKAQSGGVLFAERCIVCHGLGAVAAGYAPDLRASALSLDATAFQAVVQGGGLEIAGMPRFEELGTAELESLRHYLRARARGAP
jgi:quinohemoprotein ethanol dehydrogenase